MRSTLFLAALAPLALSCTNPDTDACISALSASLALATSVCHSYTTASSTASAYSFSAYCTKPAKLSSACSCVVSPGATTLATSTKASTTTTKAATTTSTTKASSSVGTVKSTTTTKATVSTVAGSETICTVTAYASIASAVSSCSQILLSGISAECPISQRASVSTDQSSV